MSFYREVYEELRKITLPTQEKQGMTYAPWASAWDELMKVYPDSVFQYGPVTRFEDGTAMVEVTVTIKGKTRESATRTEQLPVLNGNKPVANPNAFHLNTAYKRCLVKCLGLFGLGLYIYEGEDMPDYDEDTAQNILDSYVNLATEADQEKFWKACGQPEPSERNLELVDPQKLKPAIKWIKQQVEAA